MREEEIKDAFVRALNTLLERKEEIFTAYETIIAGLAGTVGT